MPRIKSLDLEVEDHMKYLRRHIGAIKRNDPRAGKNYESFVGKLLLVFSDNPPTSWRFVVTSYKYPTFRIFNKKTGRSKDFLRVFPTWGMAITPSILNDKYRHLFPQKGGWYNSGDQVNINFSLFGQRKQQEYVEAIQSIINANPELTLNFTAHT